MVKKHMSRNTYLYDESFCTLYIFSNTLHSSVTDLFFFFCQIDFLMLFALFFVLKLDILH